MKKEGKLLFGEVRDRFNNLLMRLAGEDGEWWLKRLDDFLIAKNPFHCLEVYKKQHEAGWMLMCDTEFDDKAFFERGVRLVKFCKPSDFEAEVIGCEMRRRAKKLNANFSQECAMMLLEMPELIPKSWRKRKIVFSGTMWKDENYDRVPYLVWRGEKHGWQLDFGYSAGMWDGSFRLLAFRS